MAQLIGRGVVDYRRPQPTSRTAAIPGGLTDAALKSFNSAIGLLGPNGDYMKGIEAGLERGKTKAVASGMAGLVGAGLSNTTRAGGLGLKYEEEVGAPTRANATSQRIMQLANLYASLGGAQQSAFENAANRSQSLAGAIASRPESSWGQYRPLPTLLAGSVGSRVNVPTSAPAIY